jgi:hypothetical protein
MVWLTLLRSPAVSGEQQDALNDATATNQRKQTLYIASSPRKHNTRPRWKVRLITPHAAQGQHMNICEKPSCSVFEAQPIIWFGQTSWPRLKPQNRCGWETKKLALNVLKPNQTDIKSVQTSAADRSSIRSWLAQTLLISEYQSTSTQLQHGCDTQWTQLQHRCPGCESQPTCSHCNSCTSPKTDEPCCHEVSSYVDTIGMTDVPARNLTCSGAGMHERFVRSHVQFVSPETAGALVPCRYIHSDKEDDAC